MWYVPLWLPKLYSIQGVWLASLAHSLLVYRFHLCIYCMEGYCVHGTSVPVCSMNNKQWFKGQVYSKLQASLHCGNHTLHVHQPCVQSLSFKSTLALWMPAHWTPSLWPTVAIPQRKKWHLPGGLITSSDLPLRTHAQTHTHTHTHKHAYYMIC